MPTFTNLDSTHSFPRLREAESFDVRRLTAARMVASRVALAEGLDYYWGATPVTDEVIALLSALADEQELIAKYRMIAGGAVMNTGERRLVLHHLLRGQLGDEVVHDGRDQRAFYAEQTARVAAFADDVRSGRERSETGHPFTAVVQVGIGGSDLGPRALYLALESWAAGAGVTPQIAAHFISNVDPDDAAAVLATIDWETTLFVLVSKSGTTQETLANEQFVARLAQEAGVTFDLRRHTVAVTSQTSPMAEPGRYRESFYIDDFIGGRYSATSPVGGVVLSVAFGSDIFTRILAGAHAADRAALEPDLRRNATLLDAMIGVYERNVLGMPATAILPYSQALSRFPAHLQQLDMESNGKSVNRDGAPISYATGPVVFGEPGTNGQHSFYQLLHQGTDVVPLQFIAFRASQRGRDTEFAGSTSQTKLLANLAAQVVAFATGRDHDDPNRRFAGGRPSTLIVGNQLGPEQLGALLAFYENKVMFQGLVWNINSFDQEGVQLGKILTGDLLAGRADADGPLAAVAKILDAHA